MLPHQRVRIGIGGSRELACPRDQFCNTRPLRRILDSLVEVAFEPAQAILNVHPGTRRHHHACVTSTDLDPQSV